MLKFRNPTVNDTSIINNVAMNLYDATWNMVQFMLNVSHSQVA
jgi:hypothetical protein